MKKLTQLQVKHHANKHGLSFKRTEAGDFRLAYRMKDNEASAHYTDDLEDAYETVIPMVNQMVNQRPKVYMLMCDTVWPLPSSGNGRYYEEYDTYQFDSVLSLVRFLQRPHVEICKIHGIWEEFTLN